MSPWKVILATIVIFAAGVITGGVLVNRLQRPEHRPGPPPPFARPRPEMVPTPWFARREFLDRMDHHLNLSREQYDRILRILEDSQQRTRRIVSRVNPEIQDELRNVRREIRTELTPEQAKKFDELEHLLRRPGRPPNEMPDMRRGPPPGRGPPPSDRRPETNTP